ncbi:hypothetical protein HPB48_014952 [Haemaphysalis longicornis]|uniref:CCHC-type domain-containing protein n=1 Tax=Haemaphysalis longicornis TaxID=44386 RepID=A0A9J6FGB5_HAELO|nr:hypothetical protein HPB48_014952 [Haemaphysalis longicornis]
MWHRRGGKKRRSRTAKVRSAYVKATLPDVRLTLHALSVDGFGLRTNYAVMDPVLVGKVDPAKLFLEAGSIVLKCSARCAKVQRDFLSEAPQMRFKDISSRMSCEIILNDFNSLRRSRPFDDSVSLDRNVQILGAVCQLPAELCGIDQQDEDRLPDHAFTITGLFFLQQCKPATLIVLQEWRNLPMVKGRGESESCVGPKDQEVVRYSGKGDSSMGQLWVQLLGSYAVELKLDDGVMRITKSKTVLIVDEKWEKFCIAIKDLCSSKTNLAYSISCEGIFIRRCLHTSPIYFTQLRSRSMLTQLPARLLCISESESELDQEEDKGKGRSRKPPEGPGGKEATNEVEDGASSCSSGRAQDADEDDSELSFIEVDDNLDSDLEEAVGASGDKKGELRTQAAQQQHQVTHVLQFVEPSMPTHQRVRGDFDRCKVVDSSRSFTQATLVNGKPFPHVCSLNENSKHLQKGCSRQRFPESENLPVVTKSFSEILSDVCQDVMKDCSPHPHEEAVRQKLFGELESFIRELYTDAKLNMYGSSCNGFGSVRSDLDICLTLDSSEDGKSICHTDMIKELARKLRKHPDMAKIIAITIARVPIVKFYHVPSNLEGDISLFNALALHNTRLLRMYSDIDKRVRILGCTFKHFAKTCNIGDASCGSLSSYAYTLMTIYYLQQCKPPIVPVLQELYQEGREKPQVIVKGCNVWFFDDIDRLQGVWSEFGQNNKSVGELWLGLLTFYTEVFNFKEQVVCIRQKAPLTKLQKMWTNKCIAIEDPFDLDHNVGGGVSHRMSAYIMKVFNKARFLFATPITKLPDGYSTYTGYFFDLQLLTDGQPPPNDRRCFMCGKIGHRSKECSHRSEGPWEEEKAFALNPQRSSHRTLWQIPNGRALNGRTQEQRSACPTICRDGIKNQTIQEHQQQPRSWSVHQPSDRVPDRQVFSPHDDAPRWRQQQKQQRQSHPQKPAQQAKEPQEQQRAPRESDLLVNSGHPGPTCKAKMSLPTRGIIPSAMLSAGINDQEFQHHHLQSGEDLAQRKMRTGKVRQPSDRVTDGQMNSPCYDQQKWKQYQRQPQPQKQAQRPKESQEQQRGARESSILAKSGHPGSAPDTLMSLSPEGIAFPAMPRGEINSQAFQQQELQQVQDPGQRKMQTWPAHQPSGRVSNGQPHSPHHKLQRWQQQQQQQQQQRQLHLQKQLKLPKGPQEQKPTPRESYVLANSGHPGFAPQASMSLPPKGIAAPVMSRCGINNQAFQQKELQQVQDLGQKKMRTWPAHQPSGCVSNGQPHSSHRELQRWQQQQQQQQQQLHPQKQAQQTKGPQEQKTAPRESYVLANSGRPASAPQASMRLPAKGIAPPGVTHAQLQRVLQAMMEAGLCPQMGGKSVHSLAPPQGTASRLVAPRLGPPPGPPPFPAANEKKSPRFDAAPQTPLLRTQQHNLQAQTQDISPKRCGKFHYASMPPPGRAMPGPPSLSHSQHEVQRHGALLGQRTTHGVVHPPNLLRRHTSNHASSGLFPNRH